MKALLGQQQHIPCTSQYLPAEISLCRTPVVCHKLSSYVLLRFLGSRLFQSVNAAQMAHCATVYQTPSSCFAVDLAVTCCAAIAAGSAAVLLRRQVLGGECRLSQETSKAAANNVPVAACSCCKGLICCEWLASALLQQGPCWVAVLAAYCQKCRKGVTASISSTIGSHPSVAMHVIVTAVVRGATSFTAVHDRNHLHHDIANRLIVPRSTWQQPGLSGRAWW